MKVIHLCTFPDGGAGLASQRIHEALLDTGVESMLFHRDDYPGKFSPFRRNLSRCMRKSFDLFRSAFPDCNPAGHSESLFRFNSMDFLNGSDADIIHLHWICGDFLALSDLPEIRKKLVWTLHDSWAFCGSEFHPVPALHDLRFAEGYTPQNKINRGPDFDRFIWEKKRRLWKDLKITFAAPSQFEASSLTESMLFRETPCAVIRNPLDLNCFTPEGPDLREKFQIRTHEKVILFGAERTLNPLKGFHLLREAVNKLKGVRLVCFGSADSARMDLPPGSIFTGTVTNPAEMAALYRTADVFACPSLADNLPNTCVESLACGTPIAGFRIGGIPELAGEKRGICVEPFRTKSLTEAIAALCQEKKERSSFCRSWTEENCAPQRVAEQYTELYRTI